MKTIVVDTFGADAGAAPIIRGCLRALQLHPDLRIVFVGDEAELSSYCSKGERIEWIHTTDYIKNEENPAVIFGGRDTCSMALAYERLKNDENCIGMLSPGSTGALLIGSICRLGLLGGLKVPALSSYLPLYDGRMVCLVDCGANIQCTAKDLARFGVMGDAFCRSMQPKVTPKVALLSVGKEEGKGGPLQKEAFGLLQQLPLQFIGNMEGSDLVSGYADVVVADGFAGNILLKSIESAGMTARGMVQSIAAKAGEADSPMVQEMLIRLSETFDLNPRGGATFLGTAKTVIKMHGCAVENTPVACIDQLLRLEASGFITTVEAALQQVK
ncbi:MAG: hypothetical protein IJP35_00125 [Clostridia bacterium]|nr:hypothetical protein [Clostridia bacterium]